MFEKEITEKLKAMKRSGMTYAEISKATKFPASYIHQVVTGAKLIRNPTVKAVMNVFPNAFIKFGVDDEETDKSASLECRDECMEMYDADMIIPCEKAPDIPDGPVAAKEELCLARTSMQKMVRPNIVASKSQKNKNVYNYVLEKKCETESKEEDEFELLDKLMSSNELSDDLKVTIFKLFSKCKKR